MATTESGTPDFTPMINGNGLEAAQPDEDVEDTYFRLIVESPYFQSLDPENQDLFLLEIAMQSIAWTLNRHDY